MHRWSNHSFLLRVEWGVGRKAGDTFNFSILVFVLYVWLWILTLCWKSFTVFYSFFVVTDFWVLLQSIFFVNNRTQLFVQTHSPPPSYPLIPLTSLTPFRKTLLITSQHTGKTYSFNLSWNVTMRAGDTNVNKNPISWRSIVQSSNSVLRKFLSWGQRPKKMLQDVLCEEV